MDNNDFEYIRPVDLGKGRHQQTITFNGEEVGYLVMKEKNWLTPIEDSYFIPDVEYGMQPKTMYTKDGLDGWIEFKMFKEYDEALQYVKDNFDKVKYLFQHGDYD